MKTVLQRVKNASVTIDNKLYSSIGKGLLILFGVEKGDTNEQMEWLAKKILEMRIFPDDNGKMNKSVMDINGELLVVSQFTLAADCSRGTRPGFDKAQQPDLAKVMYEEFVAKLRESGLSVNTGVFAAIMEVKLSNDGPVTIILEK